MHRHSTTSEETGTIATLLATACLQIAQILQSDKSIARLEARVLASHAWNVTSSWLIAHDTDVLTSQQGTQFQALLERRLNGEPIAYITGEREFYGRSFVVTPAVLIPRPETELLVEVMLAQIPLDQPIDILELGTGSGCIALSLALERPHVQVTAVEQDDGALAVAKINALNLGAQVEILKSNWFSALAHRKFDFIVSNPPYVPSDDPHLRRGDVRFEPLCALVSGAKGADDLAHIISKAPSFLKAKGSVYLEHGYDQSGATAQLLTKAGFSSIQSWLDLSGIARVTTGKLSE